MVLLFYRWLNKATKFCLRKIIQVFDILHMAYMNKFCVFQQLILYLNVNKFEQSEKQIMFLLTPPNVFIIEMKHVLERAEFFWKLEKVKLKY